MIRVWRIVMVYFCLFALAGCSLEERTFYELSATSGTMTRESTVTTLDIPIANNLVLTVMSLCYALELEEPNVQPCDVWFYADGEDSDSFRFESLDFSADQIDPPGAQIEIQAYLPLFGQPPARYKARTWPAKAWIDLGYEANPQRFVLNMPPVSFQGTTFQPPPVTFVYERGMDVVSWW